MSDNPIDEVLDRLLAPEGCPWDRKQTPLSLCDYLVEECFELAEAIRSGVLGDIDEELGDVFFLLFFILRLYRDHNLTADQVYRHSATKMIRRHPHVFSDTVVGSIRELWDNWERIKKEEKSEKETGPGPKRAFASLPASLPPLLRAYRINAKAARVGFTWHSDEDQETALGHEWHEWLQALDRKDKDHMEDEFGDYLFALVEYGRRRGLKANAALSRANAKFLRRYAAMEDLAAERGYELDSLDLESKNELWDEAKAGSGVPAD
ncbi:MAG: nucleoside triphosphate pyrophosphohydrolase [Deltaproteobacteria bacterium]|nr:nucleoside triphosphate pyrophosphohydrolase [Deltaproteobacteria bacterium]